MCTCEYSCPWRPEEDIIYLLAVGVIGSSEPTVMHAGNSAQVLCKSSDLVRVSIAAKIHHDHCTSYNGKTFNWGGLHFQR